MITSSDLMWTGISARSVGVSTFGNPAAAHHPPQSFVDEERTAYKMRHSLQSIHLHSIRSIGLIITFPFPFWTSHNFSQPPAATYNSETSHPPRRDFRFVIAMGCHRLFKSESSEELNLIGKPAKRSLYERCIAPRRASSVPIPDDELKKYTGMTMAEILRWAKTRPGMMGDQPAALLAVGSGWA